MKGKRRTVIMTNYFRMLRDGMRRAFRNRVNQRAQGIS